MKRCSFNEREFGALIESTKRSVLNAIYRHLDPGLVSCIDDVAQEVYLRVCRNGHTFHGERTAERLNSWIYSIARNESFRMNVKMRKKLEDTRDDLDDLIVPDTENGEERRDEIESTILLAVDSLPEKHRVVIRLLLHRFSIVEIADRLSISEGTVKSRIHRAREKLARLLSEQELDYR